MIMGKRPGRGARLLLCAACAGLLSGHALPVRAAEPAYVYTYEFGEICDFTYTESHGVGIYSDDQAKTELFTGFLDKLPEKLLKQFSGQVFFFAAKPVNRYVRYDTGDPGFKGLGSLYNFGVLEGLTGMYDTNYNQLDVQSGLPDDAFLMTVAHEMGHRYKVLTGGSLPDGCIGTVQVLTNMLSPLHNGSHISGENEAYAEAFAFYCLHNDELKAALPNVWGMFGE